ncbi:MAG: hypothetical protein BMS9Abin01_2119 [Gammaproteobacteria bacterium]|nr:MAG: hypothetical protein BMS9Abin01_2119 [Gammaproteobacteria bacterium]
MKLDKDEFVGTISTLYLCAAVPLAVALGMVGFMGPREYLWSTAAAAPLFPGVLVGQWLRARISQSAFRRGLLLMLLVVGARLIVPTNLPALLHRKRFQLAQLQIDGKITVVIDHVAGDAVLIENRADLELR